MPKYRVNAVVVGGKYIGEFDAENPEEAEQLAWNSDQCDVSFCWQCTSDCEGAEIEKLCVELVKE